MSVKASEVADYSEVMLFGEPALVTFEDLDPNFIPFGVVLYYLGYNRNGKFVLGNDWAVINRKAQVLMLSDKRIEGYPGAPINEEVLTPASTTTTLADFICKYAARQTIQYILSEHNDLIERQLTRRPPEMTAKELLSKLYELAERG